MTVAATDRTRVDGRAVRMFVVLDLVSYALVFWLLIPLFSRLLANLDETTQTAIGWVVSIVRLTLVGILTVRSYRRRRGLRTRTEVVPTMAVAAGVAFVVQVALGALATTLVGRPYWTWALLGEAVTWFGCALLAILFVTPGDAERLSLRYRALGDRGSVSMLLIPAVAGLVVVSVVAIKVIGSATNDRAQSTTAADAAALAAVDRWSDALEDVFDAARGASDPDDFWGFAGTDLGSLTSGSLSSAARSYAAANGAELLSLSIDPARAEVTATVRDLDVVPTSGRQIQSVATAQLQLRSGVCRSGSTLGYLVSGVCRTAAPRPTPTPTPTPDPTATPTPPPPPPPFEAPRGIGPFDARAVLVPTP